MLSSTRPTCDVGSQKAGAMTNGNSTKTPRNRIATGRKSGSRGRSQTNAQIPVVVRERRDADRGAHLQSILDHSAVTTVAVHADGTLDYVSPSARMLFSDLHEVGTQSIERADRLFDDECFSADMHAVLAGRGARRREVLGRNGRWYMREMAPYAASPDGVIITFSEISDLKKVEQGIEVARAYLDSIIATIRQPLVVLDEERRVISASSSFHRLFDVTQDQLIGKHLPSAVQYLNVPAFQHFLQSIELHGATIEDCEMDLELGRLGRRTFSMNARVLREQASVARKILVAIVDITQARHEGDAMQAARLEAERANMGKSKFLAAASHDLRQPLQTISLIQGLLKNRATDEQTQSLVHRLDETITTMSSLLDRLLDINQLEAGTVRPEIKSFPLDGLLGELRSEFLFHTATKQLDWRVVPSSLTVLSDPRLLEQIVRNLLSNAVKYTERGKILLGCRRQGEHVRIEIWDTGVGIPQSELSAIFEEFHQLNNPARERARGMGLGLSIVNRLATLLGHTISVRSTGGGGSVFSVAVPLGRTAKASLDLRENTAPPAIAFEGRVLVVEDDPDLRDMLQCLFETEGLRTTAAADALHALELLEEHKLVPDLVVADYNLPRGMSGLQLIERLQAGKSNPPRAIVLTGDISTASLLEIARHDCLHVNKPVTATDLLRLSRGLLEQAARTRSASPASPEPTPASCERQTIYVVDDDAGLRETIREVLQEAGHDVSIFASGEAFLAEHAASHVGCLLVDAVLPGLGGVEVIARIRAGGSEMPAIVMTGNGAVPMAVAAMKAGAMDFIEKPVRGPELAASVSRALALNRSPSAASTARSVATGRMAGLTTRQKQILRMILAGRPNKNIAADLSISQRTVENHRAAIMRKTGSDSLPDLVRTALASG